MTQELNVSIDHRGIMMKISDTGSKAELDEIFADQIKEKIQ